MGYEELLAELQSQGIYPDGVTSQIVNSVKDRDEATISEMEALTGLHYSHDQRQVLSHRGNLNIIACAGSGKTTSLAHLIAKRIKSGEIADTSKMVCTTFSKDGATDLEKRIKSVMKSVGLSKRDLRVCTLHAFFYELLRIFGVNKKVITESTRLNYIREACKSVISTIQKDDITTISTWISYQINNLYSDAKIIKKSSELTVDIDEEKYSNIRKMFAYSKESAGEIDFDDMQLLIYTWACVWAKSENDSERSLSSQVRAYCKAMYKYYFIDEAQDISKIQFRILKALILSDDEKRTESNVVFIGDDDQAIYSWRGSDSSIILGLGAVFDLQTFMLNTNYRCGRNILEFSAKSIIYNAGRYSKEMQAYNSDGDVQIELCDNSIFDYSRHAVNKVKELIANGYSAKDIAILTRQNNHACLLGYMLAEEGIYSKCREEMKFKNQQVYSDIKDLMAWVDGTDTKFSTERILWKMVKFLSRKSAKSIANDIDSCNLHFNQWIKIVSGYSDGIDVPKPVKSALVLQLEKNMSYQQRESIRDICAAFNKSSYTSRMKHLFAIYMANTFGYLYKNADNQRVVTGAMRYTESLLEKESQGNSIEKVRNFWRIMEQFESGSMEVPGEKVTISTVHSSKGREWDAVILLGVDLVGFPNGSNITSLVDQTYNSSSAKSELDDYINEERRLFYVGCTRAKTSLTIETCRIPSPFLLESMELVDYSDDIVNAPNNFVEHSSERGYDGEMINQFVEAIKNGKNHTKDAM